MNHMAHTLIGYLGETVTRLDEVVHELSGRINRLRDEGGARPSEE